MRDSQHEDTRRDALPRDRAGTYLELHCDDDIPTATHIAYITAAGTAAVACNVICSSLRFGGEENWVLSRPSCFDAVGRSGRPA